MGTGFKGREQNHGGIWLPEYEEELTLEPREN